VEMPWGPRLPLCWNMPVPNSTSCFCLNRCACPMWHSGALLLADNACSTVGTISALLACNFSFESPFLARKGAFCIGRCNANASSLDLLHGLVHGLNSAVAITKSHRNLVHEPLLRESAVQQYEHERTLSGNTTHPKHS